MTRNPGVRILLDAAADRALRRPWPLLTALILGGLAGIALGRALRP